MTQPSEKCKYNNMLYQTHGDVTSAILPYWGLFGVMLHLR